MPLYIIVLKYTSVVEVELEADSQEDACYQAPSEVDAAEIVDNCQSPEIIAQSEVGD